jgi:two-component sensor histidine kinase
VSEKSLSTQNIDLRKLLEQAGLDAAARDVAEQIQTVLTDEIHHRMKNVLAMVTAIVRQSVRAANSLAGAEAAINTRLVAMAKAHDLLLKTHWKSAGLAGIIHGAIDQHDTAARRIDIAGEDLEIISAAILPLTLLLNELCTNATKYGSLSKEGGRVTLSWAAAAGSLVLRWVESGGPPVLPPAAKSFGTRLMQDALPRQLGGTAHLSFPPAGAEFELIIPLEKLKPGDPA